MTDPRLWISLVLTASLAPAGRAQFGDEVTAEWDFEEARQFDFWVGEWDTCEN